MCSKLQAAPLIMSHRAGMGHFSQASPASIQYSIALGIDFIELDLRLSADDVPVVHHDQEINPQLCAWRDGRTPLAELVTCLIATGTAESTALWHQSQPAVFWSRHL